MNNNENNENNENVQKKKNVRLNKYDKKVIKRILCKHTSSAYSKKYARLQVPINSIRVLASKELGKEMKKKFGEDTELTKTKMDGEGNVYFPHLSFKYHSKNLDGSTSKKWTTSFIHHNYCSNCGRKIT